jgi:hypothetical protein
MLYPPTNLMLSLYEPAEGHVVYGDGSVSHERRPLRRLRFTRSSRTTAARVRG